MEAKASEIFNGYRNFFYRTMQFVFFCFFLIVFSPSTLTAAPQFGGLQTTKVGSNKGSISVRYDQLGLSVGDVVVVSVTADNSAHQSVIVQGAGHPGGTTVYNASDTTAVQPRLRVDVLVYDGSWPSKLNYTFAVPDNETWIAYVTKWTGVDTTNPVAGSAGNFNGVTLNPTSPGLTAPENDLVAIAVYGAREDDFAANGTPASYTPLAIGASNIGKSGSSSGIAYKGGISAGSLPAAVWTQAAATHVHAAHVLLRSSSGTPTASPPSYSPVGGNYTNSVTVSLSSATSGASIHYTTNGSTPSSGSTLYNGAFTLTSSATVKAIAIATGFNDSVVTSQTYTIAPPGSGNIQFGGLQTTKVGSNKGSISVRYDQLGLSVGDVVVVSVTADNSAHQSVIVQGAGHPGGTTVYNASDTTAVQPRLRVDVLVYDGSWPSKLNYTFAVPDNETWIAYVTKWTGVDTTNPVAGSAGNFNGVTLNPTSPGLTAPENDLVAIAVYGAREDDFAANGTPASYTPLAIGASNIGKSGSSSGIAYKGGISAGSLPAAVWTQAAATHVHAAHVLLRSSSGTPTASPPSYSPVGGNYTNSVTVSLSSATSGASIHYTTNGSTPSSGSTLYNGAFTLTSSATVKAIAIATGFNDSVVTSQTYTIAPTGGNQPPVANAGGPYNGVAGNPISFNGSGSFDPDMDSLTYSWNFGDGSAAGSGVSPNHTYSVPGNYTVSLTVNDGTVNSVVSTAPVTVTSGGGSGNIQFGGLQTTKVGSNKGSISVRYDQLGLSVGDVVVVSVTADNSAHQSVIVQGAGHPGGTTVYNASDTTAVQPRLRVDVLVYDGSWPSKLNYTFAVPDNETWIAYVTKWTGVDTTNPVAGSAGNFNGVTLNPTSPGLTAPENDLVAIAVYGAREDDFAANGTPASYTPLAIGASNIGKSGSSSGIAYKGGISAGSLPAAVWTQAAATHVHAAHVLLRSDDGTPPPTPIFADNFNDGNAIGWSVDDECQKGNSNWSVVNNVLMQTDDCRGFTVAEGAAVGTQVLSNVSLPAGVDITVRLRSEDPDSDAASNNNGAGWKFGNLGVLFGYQDANNYYRFEFNGLKGHRKLWRKQGGAFTELNTSPQSFVRGQWMVLRIVHRNGVILVFVDGQQVMSAADTAFSAGGLGLFCARDTSCSFDDVSVLSASTDPQLGLRLLDSAAPTEPALPVQSYGEYFVDSDSVLEVVAVATAATGVGGVEFVVDEGTGNAVSQTDLVAPYRRQFTTLSTGEHTVTGYLLDGSGVRLTAPEARVSLPQIATNGIHLYTQGDSITAGLKDDVTADDTSLDTRNTAGGYQPVLNDELSAGNGVPVTVLNDGNAGEESGEGAARMASILSHSPEAQAYVMFYGANDSGGALPTPSGLGTVPDTVTPVTFKDYLQQMINAVTGAGKQIYLVKATPFLANLTRDALVVEYNQVVDELVSENGLGYVAADLYSYFTANPGEFSPDLLHPNGTGYASIARLICEQLNGQMGLVCIP